MTRSLLFALFCSAILSSCSNSPVLGTLENKSIAYERGNVKVEVSYPEAVGFAKGEQIDFVTDSLLRSYLSLDGVKNRGSYSELVAQIDSLYSQVEFASSGFELISNWGAYMNGSVVSILNTSMVFAGGAHPSTFYIANTFLQGSGERVDILNYIDDIEGFRRLLIDKFLSVNDLPEGATKEQTGLFVDINELPIAKNLYLTSDGLQAIYNQYEIAPYFRGQIILDISYDLIKFKEGISVQDLIYYGTENK